MGKLKFRDFLNVDYAPGMPDSIKRSAAKRKKDSGPSGSNAEYSSTTGPRTEKFDAYAALAKMAGTPKNPDKGSVYSHLAKSKDVQKAFKDKKLKKEQAEEELDEARYVKTSPGHLQRTADKIGAKWNDEKQAYFKNGIKVGHIISKPTMKPGGLAGMPKKTHYIHDRLKEEVELDEALTATQRRARARQMKRYKSRIKIGQEKAKRRMASQEKLQKRARKAARTLLFKKLTKGMDKSELTFQRRQEIEKRLDKMKPRIDKLAKKLLPQVRKAEMSKRQSRNKAAD